MFALFYLTFALWSVTH